MHLHPRKAFCFMVAVAFAAAWGGSLSAAAGSPPGTDERACLASGGTWDPLACGHYDCGAPPDCTAVIPGCDCGVGRSFVPEVGCVTDPTCRNFCGADLDDDGQVGFGDLLAVLSAWGPCGECPEDLDADGDVGFGDLLQVLQEWGSCLFDYGPVRESAEAEQIALEMLGPGGPLVVTDDLYERVVRDQALIRAALPELTEVVHSAAWPADLMIVKILHGVPADDYATLNTYYQVVEERLIWSDGTGDWFELTLPRRINVPTLGLVYAVLEEVEYAEHIGIVGMPTSWVVTETTPGGTWRWRVESGWLDCQAGCICKYVWVVDVDPGGAVELVSFTEPDDPICWEEG